MRRGGEGKFRGGSWRFPDTRWTDVLKGNRVSGGRGAKTAGNGTGAGLPLDCRYVVHRSACGQACCLSVYLSPLQTISARRNSA